MNQPITYDRHGRMNYHPEYHAKQGQPWTTHEQAYLINNYERLGPEEVSLALERTIHTVMTRAYELRKAGEMPKPTKRKWHRRSRLDVSTSDVSAGHLSGKKAQLNRGVKGDQAQGLLA